MSERQPNGQPKRDRKAERFETLRVALEARVRHRKAQDIFDACDPRCATELGRLWRKGVITQAQHDAGLKYAEVKDKARRAIAAPVPLPASPGARAVMGPALAFLADEGVRKERQRNRRWTENWNRLRAKICEWDDDGLKGRVIWAAVDLCVSYDAEPRNLHHLKRGLWWLADFFKIRY